MKPAGLTTNIFLDGGNPRETEEAKRMLGFLDGQTTNPTLIAKHPYARERLEQHKKFTKEEIFAFYKQVVTEISSLIPHGSVSVEVYADTKTQAEDMLAQAQEMNSWIPNAHIKFPITREGLTAAEIAVARGMRVNMTLMFTQAQGMAVYAATKGAVKGQVFVSPFVGRLDDRGENGMDVIKNIKEMYKAGDGHVEVLAASVRNMSHFFYALHLGSDIITAPWAILKEWAERGMPIPGEDFIYDAKALVPIPYQTLDMSQDWRHFDISHELTDKGIERFANDWNALIENTQAV